MAVASGLLGAVGSILFARGDCDVWTRLSRIPTSFYRDKVVLITGSNSGIGKAMCEVLARMQANLIISGRDEGALAALSHSLLALGARSVRVCVLDLSHGSDVVEDAARRACGMHGRLDVLINNGGVSVRASAAELELAGVKRVMDINYFAPVALTRACLPALLRHNIHRGDQGGIIINTSSIASTIALPNRSSYASSKAALERFFDAFRHENPSVHVLSLLPGRTATNLSRNAVTPGSSTWGKTDAATAKGLAPERVAERGLAAAACRLQHAWVAVPLELAIIRLATYCPDLWRFIASQIF